MSRVSQCGLHAVLWAHKGILIRFLAAEPAWPYRRTFVPLSVFLWNDLADPVFDGVGLAGFKSRANAFFIGLSCSVPFCLLLFFPLFLSIGSHCMAGVL